MGIRSALEKIALGPKVGQVQRAALGGGVYPDLGRYPYMGGIPFGPGYSSANYLTPLAQEAYETVGPVAAVMAVRLHVFSEVTFRWQRLASDGRPGGFFGSSELSLLERPWEGASTPDLLNVMELDGSLAGNCYLVREKAEYRNNDVLTRLDPCKVTLATEGITEPLAGQEYGTRLLGYFYTAKQGATPIFFPPEVIVHFRPLPSRQAPQFLGQSWLSAVLPDASSDAQMTEYKQSFLANGAVPGLVVSFKDAISPEEAKQMVDVMRAQHTGPATMGKTLYLGAGADVKTVGMNFEQLNIKAVQGATETRIAAAAGVPATIVGFSEGLQGSTLNAGNYGSARRRFGDGTLRPLWRKACSALVRVMQTPSAFNGVQSRLWFDDRDVAFLQEDVKDDADIRSANAQTIRALIDAGYKPDAAAAYANTGDVTALTGQHTGLFSVQLQPPGTQAAPAVPPAA